MIKTGFTCLLLGSLACVPASAFWGWSDNDQYGQYGDTGADTRADGSGDVAGDASAEGEVDFTFGFKGRTKQSRRFSADVDSDTEWGGYSYDYPYWYGVPGNYGPYGMPYTPGPQVAPPPQ